MNIHKTYKTIGEVARIIKTEPHVIRFWEDNFAQIKPLKRKGGRRLYSDKDIKILRRVKALLHDESFSIKEVKNYLSKKPIEKIKEEGRIKITNDLKIKLLEIKEYLIKAKKLVSHDD
tara:strand:+ start:5722 stop:6075 length:354 start_codon:yes stop_codon:yes gene_type:complete